MADIGSLLRETRIRNKIDITTVEEATKIRAKYLRALENEEWVVLPGPDLRQDVPAHLRAVPGARPAPAGGGVQRPLRGAGGPGGGRLHAPSAGCRDARHARGHRPRAGASALGVLVLAFLGFLLVLGLTGGDDDGERRGKSRTAAARERPARDRRRGRAAGGRGARAGRGRKTVRLEVVAARPVWVCVVDAQGTERVEGRDRWPPATARARFAPVVPGDGRQRRR